jgi:hypothetical protein
VVSCGRVKMQVWLDVVLRVGFRRLCRFPEQFLRHSRIKLAEASNDRRDAAVLRTSYSARKGRSLLYWFASISIVSSRICHPNGGTHFPDSCSPKLWTAVTANHSSSQQQFIGHSCPGTARAEPHVCSACVMIMV